MHTSFDWTMAIIIPFSSLALGAVVTVLVAKNLQEITPESLAVVWFFTPTTIYGILAIICGITRRNDYD